MNTQKAQQIKGWMSSMELAFLAELATDAIRILEFGCYYGRSTRALADNTKGIVYAVDPWDGTYYNDNNELVNLIEKEAFNGFKNNLADHISSGKVMPIRMFSQDFYSTSQFDLIFIDGDHRYEAVKTDINNALKLIRPSGVIAGHDYTHSDWPGVKKAVDEIFGPISLIDSIWYMRIP